MLYLATPIWRYYDVRAAHSLTATIALHRPDESVYWETIDGDALISRSRSQLATKFANAPEVAAADVMVILDDDVQFQPDDLWKIVRHARELQEPVGGIYVTRSRQPHTASMMYGGQPVSFGEGGGLTEVRYLATGFMAIPRNVIDAMLAKRDGFDTLHGKQPLTYCEMGVGDTPMWDFFGTFIIRENDGRAHYLSEDWAFCERARQCGFKIWADTSIILQHRAFVSVTVFDLENEATGRVHALHEGASSKGRSVLFVEGGPVMGAEQEKIVSSSGVA